MATIGLLIHLILCLIHIRHPDGILFFFQARTASSKSDRLILQYSPTCKAFCTSVLNCQVIQEYLLAAPEHAHGKQQALAQLTKKLFFKSVP